MNSNSDAGAGDDLQRRLGPLDASMIVVGSMIGSGIFITSAESARLVGAPGWLLLAWAMAGLMTITGALCCSELATMMPRAGGVYVFLREAYGPSLGFLFGWTLLLVVQSGTIAAVVRIWQGERRPVDGVQRQIVRPFPKALKDCCPTIGRLVVDVYDRFL